MQATKTSALNLLRHDHDKVEKLFKEVEGTGDSAAKQRLAERIYQELTIHTKIEEEIFYPAAREYESQLVNHSLKEHQEAKEMIAELKKMSVSDAGFDEKMGALAEAVSEHIEDEEGKMFPDLEKTDMDFQTLGDEMADRKEELLEQYEHGSQKSS